MSWMAVGSAAVSLIGASMKSGGQNRAGDVAIQMGRAQQTEDNFQALQLRQNAGQVVAASQRNALDQKRITDLLVSRAVAVAGASGGGVTDRSVGKIIGDISGEGAYRRAVALYQGLDTERQMNLAADAKVREGEVAAQGGELKASAYRTDAAGSMFSGLANAGGTLFKKYGGFGSGVTTLDGGFAKDVGDLSGMGDYFGP